MFIHIEEFIVIVQLHFRRNLFEEILVVRTVKKIFLEYMLKFTKKRYSIRNNDFLKRYQCFKNDEAISL